MTNSRQMGVVETVIWVAAALAASMVALGVFLLMAAVGAVMLLAGMASHAVRSIFGQAAGSRAIYQRRSSEQRDYPEPGMRSQVLEGEVLHRSE